MLSLKPCLIVWLLTANVCLNAAAEVNMANNATPTIAVETLSHKLSGIIQWKYEKRPFCNAFTGCGKKRTSSHPPYPIIKRGDIDDKTLYNSNDYISEGLSDLIDINAEPAVENVQKQIMSQAKIYEAIKEASKEIFRQKNIQRLHHLHQNQLLKEEQDKLEDNDNV